MQWPTGCFLHVVAVTPCKQQGGINMIYVWLYLLCLSRMDGNNVKHSPLQSTKAGWWKQMCFSCPEILRDVPRAYNPPCLLASTVTFRQTWRRAETSNICSCIYILVVTQWFIIIQLLLSSPLPGHTLITPFAVGQTQVCCGQLIKYSPLQTWLSI